MADRCVLAVPKVCPAQLVVLKLRTHSADARMPEQPTHMTPSQSLWLVGGSRDSWSGFCLLQALGIDYLVAVGCSIPQWVQLDGAFAESALAEAVGTIAGRVAGLRAGMAGKPKMSDSV
jgi:hypothetical protein